MSLKATSKSTVNKRQSHAARSAGSPTNGLPFSFCEQNCSVATFWDIIYRQICQRDIPDGKPNCSYPVSPITFIFMSRSPAPSNALPLLQADRGLKSEKKHQPVNMIRTPTFQIEKLISTPLDREVPVPVTISSTAMVYRASHQSLMQT